MSQQSTLKTVIPYFEKWMRALPTVHDLARADADEVLKLWAGLGYYSRARNVHATAGQLVEWLESHGGKWPAKASEWQSFKGIGPYTAAAVASIAFSDPVVPIDGNVLRVGARYFAAPDPLNASYDRKIIEAHLREVIGHVAGKDVPVFGQALMELGALVCRPGGQALCEVCPLAPTCEARLQGKVAVWPYPKKRPVIEERHLVADIFWDGGEKMLFRKIPKGERLEGQWELPLRELGPDEIAELSRNFSVLEPVSHSITRYKFKVWAVLRGPWKDSELSEHRLGAWRESDLHLTTLTRKLLLKVDSLLN